eukprot:PhF_6_TR25727/c0_g1_i1/m.36257
MDPPSSMGYSLDCLQSKGLRIVIPIETDLWYVVYVVSGNLDGSGLPIGVVRPCHACQHHCGPRGLVLYSNNLIATISIRKLVVAIMKMFNVNQVTIVELTR